MVIILLQLKFITYHFLSPILTTTKTLILTQLKCWVRGSYHKKPPITHQKLKMHEITRIEQYLENVVSLYI